MTVVHVNGMDRVVLTHPRAALLWALRDEVGCASVKYGCGAGQCGACRVVLDGVAESSCLLTVADASGRDVRTLEGLTRDGAAGPVIEALLAVDAGQCGYCLPGIVTTLSVLRQRPGTPTRDEVTRALDDHLCRCGAHRRILTAAYSALGADDG